MSRRRAAAGQGSVRRRGGRLELRFYQEVGGRTYRLSVYGRNHAELNRKRTTKLRELFGGAVPGTTGTRYADAAASWLANCRRRVERGEMSFKTLGQYTLMVNAYIAPLIGAIDLDKLDLDELEGVLDAVSGTTSAKTGRPLKKQSVMHAFTVLRCSLYYARRHRLTMLDVPALMHDLREHVSVRQYRAFRLSVEQAAAFRRAGAQCRYGAVFTAILALLARESEVLGLRLRNVDEEKGLVYVRDELQVLPRSLRADPEESGAVIVEYVKTDLDSAEEAIEVGPKFFEALRTFRKDLIRRRSAHLESGGTWRSRVTVMHEGRLSDLRDEANDLVFTTVDGRPLSAKVLRDHLKEVCAKAGIPVSSRTGHGLRVYDLRGSAAVLLLTDPSDPVSPIDVMRRGRWKSWQMLRYYTTIWERAQSGVAKKADRIAFGE
jgi:integrase